MNEKNEKSVLIVDDEQRMCESLKDRFADCGEKMDCPYQFEVDVALSATDCAQKVLAKSYDVIVLDVVLDIRVKEERREEASGLDVGLALAFQLLEQLGWERPIRILFTGYPSYEQCVTAMRYGAWDYIVKEDVGNTSMFQIVVDSAVARLQQLDLRRELEQQLSVDWLPYHFRELQEEYGGQLVALWHKTEVPEEKVIASGRDAFELETKLKDWRKQHATWEQPMIVLIPPQRGDLEQEV